jgi:hypothetical protein
MQMSKTIALAGAVAIAAASLLLAQPAFAGGSVSAPSKYSNNQNRQIVVTQHVRQPKAIEYPITEYSSSSMKTSVPHR